jgi:hypothetical protein
MLPPLQGHTMPDPHRRDDFGESWRLGLVLPPIVAAVALAEGWPLAVAAVALALSLTVVLAAWWHQRGEG